MLNEMIAESEGAADALTRLNGTCQPDSTVVGVFKPVADRSRRIAEIRAEIAELEAYRDGGLNAVYA